MMRARPQLLVARGKRAGGKGKGQRQGQPATPATRSATQLLGCQTRRVPSGEVGRRRNARGRSRRELGTCVLRAWGSPRHLPRPLPRSLAMLLPWEPMKVVPSQRYRMALWVRL